MMSIKIRTYGVFRITIVAVSLLVLASMIGVGQTSEPSATPTPEHVASPTPLNYFIRDLPPKLVIFNKKYFSFQANFGVLADNTFVGQDSNSRSQVGPQASKFDLRAARMVLSGQIKFKRPWSYVFAGDINELRKKGDRVLDALDLYVASRFGKRHAS